MLFTVVYEVVTRIEGVPVSAPDEAAALEYLNSTTEWRTDPSYPYNLNARVVGVKKIEHPSEAPFDGETGCWGQADDVTASEAFFSEETQYPDYDSDDQRAQEIHDAWEERCLACRKLFDAMRGQE